MMFRWCAAGFALGLCLTRVPATAQIRVERQSVTGVPGGFTAGVVTGGIFNLSGLSEEHRREIAKQIEQLERGLRDELAATARVLAGQLEASGAARARAESNAARIGEELNLARGVAI